VSRRLAPPDPQLADDLIRLEPLAQTDLAGLVELVDDDAVKAFTRVPSDANPEFIGRWIATYEHGWTDSSKAGFGAQLVADSQLVAFAGFVHLDLDAREGEIGYAVMRPARGQGIAGRVLALLTAWGFDELELARIELAIDVTNPASERVAARAGYQLEGVRRSIALKEGTRIDSGLWSRLRDDPPVP
jgi:RimJ/RimL family protein N-acetyltransferase